MGGAVVVEALEIFVAEVIGVADFYGVVEGGGERGQEWG